MFVAVELAPFERKSIWCHTKYLLDAHLRIRTPLPLQLTGGAEVPSASALLVKGASLGTALIIMLVAPSAAFSVVRRLGRARNVRATVLYLGIVWFLGGSLGVAVDGIQRLFSGGS